MLDETRVPAPARAAPARWPALIGVLRQPDFLKLWCGVTISLVGMQVSGLALPLTAVLSLGASGTEMGILGAARWLPYLAFGLLAGAWLDRVRRRPVLIASHLGRALLLASIPVAALLGWLRIEQLYIVTLALGSLMIFSDAAYQALLPTLVSREDLVDGNRKLELSRSAALIVARAWAAGCWSTGRCTAHVCGVRVRVHGHPGQHRRVERAPRHHADAATRSDERHDAVAELER